ncbi:ribosome production factor 2 [Encephalitozoon cuniculi]|nr:ribosome production factor 2 [Encephalitozoon cuniculi]
MRVKRLSERKTLLSVICCTEGERIQKEIGVIRGDTVHMHEKTSPSGSVEKIEKLMKKKRSGLFLSVTKERHLVIGRAFNDELIDMVEFKINRYLSVSDFECAGPELHMKYFVVLQNINNSRLENLVVDFFNMKSSKVCLESVRYSWVFARTEEGYVLKYVRVLKDLSVEDCGPLLEMELVRSYHCSDELYKKSLGEPSKPRKNTAKNLFSDRIGTLHIDKQDLRDIRLKKSRGYNGVSSWS